MDKLTPSQLEALANEFWRGFSRPDELERAVRSWGGLYQFDRLNPEVVQQWHRDHGIRVPEFNGDQKREWLGYMSVCNMIPMVLVSSCQPESEYRFTLAHEIAHFLVEHHRHQKYLSEGGRDVAGNGALSPPENSQKRTERLLSGVLLNSPNLLPDDRTDDGLHQRAVAIAEENANRLAVEILAPFRKLEAAFQGKSHTKILAEAPCMLICDYGLPKKIAQIHARWLAQQISGGPSWREWLQG